MHLKLPPLRAAFMSPAGKAALGMIRRYHPDATAYRTSDPEDFRAQHRNCLELAALKPSATGDQWYEYAAWGE